MKNKIFGILLLVALIASSCNKYFDYTNDSLLNDKIVYGDYNNIKYLLLSTYSMLPGSFNHIGSGMLSSATDESEDAYDYSSVQNFNDGSWNPNNNPDDCWSREYTTIRRCYLFLHGTDTVTFNNFKYVDDTKYKQYTGDLKIFRGEARFMIAFAYFELFKRYGGVPILDHLATLEENLNLPRNSTEEVYKFIIMNCDSAIKVLPKSYDGSNTGRATLGTAYALKCRTFLYAASPLYNNGSYNLALCDSAAHIASVFLANGALLKSQYALESNYGTLFTRKYDSKELIFERRDGNSNSLEKANFPIGFEGLSPEATCPSQNLVDAYEMNNGKPITDPASNYNPANPYVNRDPRLGYTVIWNNSTFKKRAIELWDGGIDAKPLERASKTGYYLKKFMDDNLDLSLASQPSSRHCWYFFRLGEVYLNYAEAMNEAFGPTDTRYGLSAVDAVNAIRKRAGMPNLAAADYATTDALRQKIRNERRVELAFEEHRSWDVRRWQIAESTLGADLRGMDIVKNADASFTYTPFVVEHRTFLPKMYYYPIPESEIQKENKLVQNQDW